ncbi:DUF4941 domain-containing protein [Thermotoga sp. RQ2]|uniref:DUF4941 domain-containing protein n=1 Tax=Thermotoga sp. (strain RQ2) TaxID=126740 RepID=UPI0001600EF2|nr:conserved hypothetical protein [Thermotoga sp. RQ2]
MMRRLILLFAIFSVTLLAETITLDATLLNFDDLLQLLEIHSRVFDVTPPSTGTVGSMRYLEYNGHVLANVEDLYILDNSKLPSPGVPVETLKLFGVDYIQTGDGVEIITCRVNSIEEMGRTIVVYFEGEKNFDVEQTQDSVRIIAKDWLLFRGVVKMPEEVLYEKENVRIERTAESDGQFRILLSAESVGKYVVKPFGERVDPYEKDVVFLVGYGDGRIIVRSFSKDLNGLDLPAYSESLKLARKMANELGYKLEECPVYDIPVGVIGMIVLLKGKDEMPVFLNTVERLMAE